MNYFNPGAFVSNFHYLVSGILVIGIIILFTMLLNRVFRKK